MIRKMTENDRKLYIEMAEEFYSSDAVLHPVPREYFEKTGMKRFGLTYMLKSLFWIVKGYLRDMG